MWLFFFLFIIHHEDSKPWPSPEILHFQRYLMIVKKKKKINPNLIVIVSYRNHSELNSTQTFFKTLLVLLKCLLVLTACIDALHWNETNCKLGFGKTEEVFMPVLFNNSLKMTMQFQPPTQPIILTDSTSSQDFEVLGSRFDWCIFPSAGAPIHYLYMFKKTYTLTFVTLANSQMQLHPMSSWAEV